MQDNIIKKYNKIFNVLSDANRLKLYSILIYFIDGLFGCELSNILNLPPYTISRCVKELEKVDLIEAERNGKYILYKVKTNDDNGGLVYKHLSMLIKDEIIYKENFIEFENIRKILNNRNNIHDLCNIKL